ncbi:histone-lysine N-methyltransferase SETD8 [Mytilus galloprovincialis]|uniref:[histone H4]-lysine(20) N-methyltransferase n=1 Tax=Mytilus galloprovincialis TaxID=29158 RepID=A0A8B6DEU9_MYTGA|nr:histone-lysine N-methyltransferase SETD8 [Mytilus galloprovincialis]
MYCFFSGLKMSDSPLPLVSTPSRITDYFPPSPKTSQETGDKDEKFKETKTSKIDISNSSILLTPEPSPAKDNEKDQKDKVETDSNSSTEQPKCKQVLLEKYDEKDAEEEKPKGRQKKSTKTDSTSQNKKKASRKKKTAEPTQPSLQNSLLTDFYPVRRSNRRCKSELEKDKQCEIEDKILNKKEEGLKVEEIANKGRGVIASKDFFRGDFVVEYAGNLISQKVAKQKELDYSKDPSIGCYMYYFTHKTINYCVDATAESGRLGRLINHSRTKNNCHMKLTEINDRPYLMLVASRDISTGEELLYDYGDRNKESLTSHPWLKS